MRARGFFILVSSVAFICSVCPPTASIAQSQDVSKVKVLVVYYSRTGHTRLVAEKLAKKFNADLEQLIDQHRRTGLFGFTSACKDAFFGNVTVIAPLKHNPRDYNIIFIGGPTWLGEMTPAVRTFIMQNDLSGTKIGLFGECTAVGVVHALQKVTDLISKGTHRKFATMPLHDSDLKEEVLSKKINAFYKTIRESR